MISAVRIAANVAGRPLDVLDASIELDETRVPFGTATVTVPWDPADVALFDPRTSPRLTLELSSRYVGSDTAADLTVAHAGLTAADLTAAYEGLAATDLSFAYEHKWNLGPRRSTTHRRFDLAVRGLDIDRREGTATISASTDEQVLVDFALTSPGPVASGPTLRDVARLAIGLADPGALLVYDPFQGLATVDYEARVWQPGVSAWDYVSPVLASKGYRIWCDEQAVWHLYAADSIINWPARTLATDSTVGNVTDSISRDAPGWADAVIVTYRWTDTAGVRQTRYDVAGTGSKVAAVQHDTAWPAAGEAAWRLFAAARKARTQQITAVLDPSLYVAQPITLSAPDGEFTGYTTGVQWRVPADEMTVTIRDIEEA